MTCVAVVVAGCSWGGWLKSISGFNVMRDSSKTVAVGLEGASTGDAVSAGGSSSAVTRPETRARTRSENFIMNTELIVHEHGKGCEVIDNMVIWRA